MLHRSLELALELPVAASAPRRARRAMAYLDLDRGQRATASLLASELVTNAVLEGTPGHPIRLDARIRGRTLRLSVLHARRGPLVSDDASRANRDYGLHLLDQLACGWGATDTAVWFELEPEPESRAVALYGSPAWRQNCLELASAHAASQRVEQAPMRRQTSW